MHLWLHRRCRPRGSTQSRSGLLFCLVQSAPQRGTPLVLFGPLSLSGLAGDFHLTANVECPNPSFAKFLPCVGEKAEEWMGQCESRLSGYQQVKSQVGQRSAGFPASTKPNI